MKSKNSFQWISNIKTLLLLALMLLNSVMTKAQINVSLTEPADTTGACRSNLYTMTLSNLPSTPFNVKIVPTLNFSNSNCTGSTQGVFMGYEYVSNGTIIKIDSGNFLSFNINTTTSGTITIQYHVYIDCHISGNSNVSLSQEFSSATSNVTFNGNATYSYLTSAVLKPNLVLQLISNQYVYYKTASYLVFSYKNTVDRARVRFTFVPDFTSCSNVNFGNILFKKGIDNITTYSYTNTPFDTISLFQADTLVILIEVFSNVCTSKQLHCKCNANLAV
jgi:hypothetical protein